MRGIVSQHGSWIGRRGFTLLEALMACGILLGVVVAVTSAISAGQQNALEAHQRIAGCLAAEELLGRIIAIDYDNQPEWNGYSEDVGEMVDMKGNAMPGAMNLIGRNVSVTTTMTTVADLAIRVRGHSIRVRAFAADGRVVADLQRFVPEPIL